MTHYICQSMCSTQSDQIVRDFFFLPTLLKKNRMQCTVQTAVYANSHSKHFFSGCIMQCTSFQDLPGGIWRWSEKRHDRLDDSECHDDTAQIGVYACPLWTIDYRLELTVFMKLMFSTNFIKKLVMTGNSFVQVWWVLFCVGVDLTTGTGRPQLVIHRKWQKLWQILGKRDVTDAPGESQMCPSCPSLRMDTRVSLRLK